jgi:hypothetical protein
MGCDCVKWTEHRVVAFDELGAELRDPRWGWSERSRDRRSHVVSLWDYQFNVDAGPGRYAYQKPEWETWKAPPYRKAARNFNRCGNRVKVVVSVRDCEAPDVKTKYSIPTDLVMELIGDFSRDPASTFRLRQVSGTYAFCQHCFERIREKQADLLPWHPAG